MCREFRLRKTVRNFRRNHHLATQMHRHATRRPISPLGCAPRLQKQVADSLTADFRLRSAPPDPYNQASEPVACCAMWIFAIHSFLYLLVSDIIGLYTQDIPKDQSVITR